MTHVISVSPKTDRKVNNSKSVPFGTQPTEHMFIAEYSKGQWQHSRIVPFQEISLSPFSLCLHYGQTVFEGMKAFLTKDGRINIFRPDRHYERFNNSLHRMCMPGIPRGLFMEAIQQLVQLDAGWLPQHEDGAIYIRPFMIATEERIGLKVSEEYIFMIVCSPVHAYYSQPLKLKIESNYIRSAEGGTGYAKCGGNYGAAFYPTHVAQKHGYDQVLWTDSKYHEFIEESGTMNIMFYMNDALVTPPVSSSILDGITRDSVLTLARDMGIKVIERPVSYREIQHLFKEGKSIEAFGTGTAAVIAPVSSITIGNKQYFCNIHDDMVMDQLKKTLYNIRKGFVPDTYNWNYAVL